MIFILLLRNKGASLHISTGAADTIYETFKPCAKSSKVEKRKLFIATCETGNSLSKHPINWMKNDSLALWNLTSIHLRVKNNITMINVCQNIEWKNKLLTKPLTFHAYVNNLILEQSRATSTDLIYVMLMDSDTYWAVNDVSDIWNRFDCAREDKEMLVSTEMSCWMGYYCTKDDTEKWYSNIHQARSFSPFANSGVYIGKATLVRDMLAYIVANNATYYTLDTFHKQMKFHDQHAVADYSIRIAPHLISLDYHQQFAATFTVRISEGEKANRKASAVCKTREGSLDYHCTDITIKLHNKHQFYMVNSSDCTTYRDNTKVPSEYRYEIMTLAKYPIVWHGNGAAKKVFLQMGYKALKCMNKMFPST